MNVVSLPLSQNISLYCTYSLGTLDKVMIHVWHGMERDGARFHYLEWAQLKLYELFISGNSYLIVLDCG